MSGVLSFVEGLREDPEEFPELGSIGECRFLIHRIAREQGENSMECSAV